MGVIAAGIAGLALGAGGAALGANAASHAKRELRNVANTPNVNLNDVLGQSSVADLLALPQFQTLTRNGAIGQQQSITDVANLAIPGYSDIQANRVGNTQSLIRGEIPQDVADQVFRARNAAALGGGYGGSPRQGNLTARDLGLTSLALQQQGSQQLDDILRTTPQAKVQDPLAWLIQPSQHYGALLGERQQKLDMLGQAAGAPGATAVWGKYLTDTGSSITGLAAGSMKGGG